MPSSLWPSIGQITLNISLTIYLIWFVPQILLNFKRKQTSGLSLLMHGILYLGYLTDLLYGFGLGMQWQYRAVTIVGLLSLTIQHYQFYRYDLQQRSQNLTYKLLTGVYLLILAYAVLAISLHYHSKAFYDLAGMVANGCWLCYMFPQIITNYRQRSTQGLSSAFVILAIFLNLCDSASAWTLGWDYPSKIGPAVALVGNAILFFQVIIYAKKTHVTALAANR